MKAAEAGVSWHLIAGPTGAGKTTYAAALAERLGGVRLSIDEWTQTLFWPDLPEKSDITWALERVARCERQAGAVAASLAARGVPAVIDFGLTTREQRLGWAERAKLNGIATVLHVLESPAEERWRRVESRNRAASGTFVFPVTREMFDTTEQFWEPPDVLEAACYFALHRMGIG